MGFIDFFTKKAQEKPEDLAMLPYAREFDSVRHRNKLLTIKRLEDNCTPFVIRKTTPNNSRWEITAFDHFPLEEEVRDAVYEDYGGGKYDVFGAGTLLKSYQFPGESRGFIGGQNNPKGKPRGFTDP